MTDFELRGDLADEPLSSANKPLIDAVRQTVDGWRVIAEQHAENEQYYHQQRDRWLTILKDVFSRHPDLLKEFPDIDFESEFSVIKLWEEKR